MKAMSNDEMDEAPPAAPHPHKKAFLSDVC